MDRYHRVKKRSESPIGKNEIRITVDGKVAGYINYALMLLEDERASEIVFTAMGTAISKTVLIVEKVKRMIVGLHQNTSIATSDVTYLWHPREEGSGLLPFETTRRISLITITLSTKELDTSSPGYQPPLPEDQVKAFADFNNRMIAEGMVSNQDRGDLHGRGWDRAEGPGQGRPVRHGRSPERFEDGKSEDSDIDMGDDANALVDDTADIVVDTAP